MVFEGSDRTKMPMTRFAQSLPRVAVAAALAAAAVATACPVTAQEGDRPFGLFDKIFGGSERVGGGGDRAAPAAAGDQTGTVPSTPDLIVRVDRLETQIRQLTGVIEQLQYRNQQLEAALRRMQEEGAPRSAQPRPQTQTPPAAPAPAAPRRGDAFDPALNPAAPGAPHTLGSMPAGGGAAADLGEPPIGAPGGRAGGSPLDLATAAPPARSANAGAATTATLPPSQSPRDEFDLSYGYVLRRDYALAEDGFRSFLTKYPNDRLAGDATYWMGESLFQRQRFRDAAEAFLNVSTKFESSAKAPDALLRLGQSLALLGEKEAACASLGEVQRKFPRASASVKQGVEREQKRVRC